MSWIFILISFPCRFVSLICCHAGFLVAAGWLLLLGLVSIIIMLPWPESWVFCSVVVSRTGIHSYARRFSI